MSTTTLIRKTTTIFLPFLGLLSIGLKLTGILDWSWWWVLAPFWISAAILLTILMGAFLIIIVDTLKG